MSHLDFGSMPCPQKSGRVMVLFFAERVESQADHVQKSLVPVHGLLIARLSRQGFSTSPADLVKLGIAETDVFLSLLTFVE
jgi:hypothetical protein